MADLEVAAPETFRRSYPAGYNPRVIVTVTAVYLDWINSIRDTATRARIQVRVDRLVHGNRGKFRALTHGICELKVDVGPGYRVYYTQRGDTLTVLLAGGDKSTQARDIKMAISLATNL